MTNIKTINGINILPLLEGTDFTQIAGDDKNAMFYNLSLNNLLIVTTEDKAESEKFIAEQLAEDLKNGHIDEDEVAFDENGKIVVDLDGDFNDTTEDVIGYLTPDRWVELCRAVEYNENVTAVITKTDGTTTDYIVNYDINPQELLEKSVREAEKVVYDKLPELLENSAEGRNKARSYKTVEVINGKAYRAGDDDLYELLEQRAEEIETELE